MYTVSQKRPTFDLL